MAVVTSTALFAMRKYSSFMDDTKCYSIFFSSGACHVEVYAMIQCQAILFLYSSQYVFYHRVKAPLEPYNPSSLVTYISQNYIQSLQIYRDLMYHLLKISHYGCTLT